MILTRHDGRLAGGRKLAKPQSTDATEPRADHDPKEGRLEEAVSARISDRLPHQLIDPDPDFFARTAVEPTPAWPVRRRAIIEMVSTIGTIMLVLWTDSRYLLNHTVRTSLVVLLIIVVTVTLLRQRPTIRTMGFAPPEGWLAGTLKLALLTFVGVCAIFLVGLAAGTVGDTERVWLWLWRNFLPAGAQQVLVQAMLVPRLATIRGRWDWVVSLLASVVFFLIHAPNVGLMVMTFVAGFAWCEWFRRYRNLPALWVSHFALAACALWSLGPYLGRLRVGIGYVWM